ncbi:MAG: CopG family transcriptional regulator [Alphaproteobacteria bacterium]|nr:CopG family transcriptional regulator [Alphaproteobacteria bacterium]
MKEPILRLTPKKYTGETTIVSMRMPKDMLSQLDSLAELTGRTRNELLITCIEFSLNHMEIVDED